MTEVEAYGGRYDPASHAYGSRTERNEPMWGEQGTVYVYLSYGIHWCANIVVGPEGTPTAVLLRGGTVVEGTEIAARRRGRVDQLANGPGKIGQALGLDGAASGSTLWEGPLRLDGPLDTVTRVEATPRIGISKAMDVPWRFVERTGTDAPSSSLP